MLRFLEVKAWCATPPLDRLVCVPFAVTSPFWKLTRCPLLVLPSSLSLEGLYFQISNPETRLGLRV
jgi:hypothetical protein